MMNTARGPPLRLHSRFEGVGAGAAGWVGSAALEQKLDPLSLPLPASPQLPGLHSISGHSPQHHQAARWRHEPSTSTRQSKPESPSPEGRPTQRHHSLGAPWGLPGFFFSEFSLSQKVPFMSGSLCLEASIAQ